MTLGKIIFDILLIFYINLYNIFNIINGDIIFLSKKIIFIYNLNIEKLNS